MFTKDRFLMFMIAAVATVVISGCGGGDKKSGAREPMPSTPMTTPTPTPGACTVGGTLSAGQSCSHESPGNSFTFSVNASEQGCVGGICSGTSVTINNFSARKNNAGDWEVTALPGVAMAPSNGNNAPTIAATASNIFQFKLAQAAQNTPKAGSVTQSSDADGNGVTTDSVNIVVTGPAGQQTYVASYNGMEVVSTANGTPAVNVEDVLDRPKGTRLHERVPGGVEFYRSLGQAEAAQLGLAPGDIWIDVYTDHGGSGDTDYLAGGIWVYAPDNASSLDDYEYGAFVDGSDPFVQNNLAGVTGTATYSAQDGATGVYADAEEGRNYFFDADVTLTANFGNGSELGTISGRIHNFDVEGLTVSGNPELTLGSADIGSSNSGFFTGDTRMDVVGGSNFTGKWGGQFYGNGANPTDAPGSVAGTFGAATADGSESFLGAYGAYKQ